MVNHFVFCFFFLYSVTKWQNRNTKKNSSTFIHLYRVCFLCQASLMLGGLNSITLWHLGCWIKPVPSKGFSLRFQVSFRVEVFCLFDRVTMALSSLYGECQEFHGICIQEGIGTLKIDAGANAPVSHPLYCELAISRIKRCGVEEVMVSLVFKASLVWSVPLPLEHRCWCPHTPNHSTSNFSPFV